MPDDDVLYGSSGIGMIELFYLMISLYLAFEARRAGTCVCV